VRLRTARSMQAANVDGLDIAARAALAGCPGAEADRCSTGDRPKTMMYRDTGTSSEDFKLVLRSEISVARAFLPSSGGARP
jgi:hypothetical protein